MPLTDVFIATETELWRLAADAIPSEHFAGADIKGYDHVPLATLLCILTGRDYRDTALIVDHVEAFRPIGPETGDGPWLFRWPSALTEALSVLDHSRAESVAHEWAVTEALQRYTPKHTATILMTLVQLAKQARLEGRQLFLWCYL